MYISNTLSLFIFSVILFAGGSRGTSSVFYPSSITDSSGSHSTDQAVSVLSVQDQSGTQNTWAKYIEFDSTSAAYSGIFTFNIGSALSITGMSLKVNYLGQAWSSQQWTFEVSSAGSWVKIGDTSADTNGWNSWTLLSFSAPATVDFTHVLNAQNQIQIRFSSNSKVDSCDLDFVQLTLTTGSSSATTAATTTTATTAATTAAATTTTSTTAKATTTTAATTAATTATVATATTAAATTASATTSSGSCPITTSQTVASSWVDSGVTYTQYTVTMANVGTQTYQVVFQFSATPTAYYSITAMSGNQFGLPSWLSSGLAAGTSFQFGYTCACSSPLTITTITPSCSSGSATTAATTTATTAAATTAAATTATTGSTSTTAKSTTTTTSATSSTATTATATTTTTTTGTSGGSGPTASFALRMLVLASSTTATGVDFVKLAFDSTGVAYDVVTVSSSTSLSSYLSTSGTGKYAGIVSVSKTLLSASQQSAIIAYQNAYGVRWVIVGSSPSGLAGLSAGTKTSTKGTLTLASAFSKYAYCLQPSISMDTASTINWSGYGTASVTPATITDSSVATPAIMITIGSQAPQVAVAQIKSAADGTLQLHYFIDEVADYLHSRAFAPLMVNWLSPGMVFQGARRVVFSVQADDLFLASNKWDVNTHTDPLSDSSIYRMTDSDLQAHADYYDSLNAQLPAGSYVTVEWPFNGAGTTWYTQPDPLFAKAIALQNKFWFISHTWDHPCDLDSGSYAEMNTEVSNNIQFEPSLLTGGLKSPRFSNDSIVTPCITGLFNGQVLQAMADNGIMNCVGDNSVASLVPSNKFHGITTTTATNGYAGIFIVPRQDTDIFYDCTIPAELVDAYNTMYGTSKTFEDIMAIELAYGLELQLAFRHDPFMLHQANGRMFSYTDPVNGGTKQFSFITLFTDRVVRKVASIFSLPIMTPRMTDLVKMWKTRTNMDSCGFQATLQVSNGKITALQATSTNSCLVGISGLSLSGSTVTMETSGPETTAWIQMTAGVPQTLSLTTPISL